MTRDSINHEVSRCLGLAPDTFREVSEALRNYGFRLAFSMSANPASEDAAERIGARFAEHLDLYRHSPASREFAARLAVGPYVDATGATNIALWETPEAVLTAPPAQPGEPVTAGTSANRRFLKAEAF